MKKTICTPNSEVTLPHIVEWRLGDNALIQLVSFEPDGTEFCTDMMSGKEANELLEHACAVMGCEPVCDERGIYGYHVDGWRYECWDCDEQSYSEYEREQG